MYKILSALFILSVTPLCLYGQITPAEGALLSYRVIGFSFPEIKGTAKYDVEIAPGNIVDESKFQKNILVTRSGNKNKIIGQVPVFGGRYTWRVTYTDSNSVTTASELHHFATLMATHIDSEMTRLEILVSPPRNTDMYIFVDATGTLYDLSGLAIWRVPPMEGAALKREQVSDLKPSCLGTITFMMNGHAYEINYNGDVLWRSPDTVVFSKQVPEKTIMLYCNEFTRLGNGHYMALGAENKEATDSKIMEFDQNHEVIWSLNTADYSKRPGLYNNAQPKETNHTGDNYERGFYFDEQAKAIYLSSANTSRIIKLQYPGGKVLNTYSPPYDPANPKIKNDLFCGQHSCRRSTDGYLFIFNNNTCNRPLGDLPTIIAMQEPATGKAGLKKIWEYECTLDSQNEPNPVKLKFETGGSVFELANHSILCCMAGNYGKLFLVNRNKKVLWSALPERWNAVESKWEVLGGYRASIVTRAELEQLIWGIPAKK